VLKVDAGKRRVSLGLKASYFEDDDEEMPDVEEENLEDAGDVIETDSEPMVDDAIQIESYVPTPTESQAAPLAVEGFNWTGDTILGDEDDNPLPLDSDSDSDSEDDKATIPQKKKHKRSEIKFDKTASLAMSSAADYERTLLSQPDSSMIWTQYMAHLLQLGETDKARAVAERALKTINIREEREKFNIWVAYLNMENSFGTDESLDAVFQRACEYTEKKKMFLHLVSILIKAGKDDKADDIFQTMIKKFSQSSKVWVNYAAYLMEHNRADEGRELLPRSLKILPTRKRRSPPPQSLIVDVKTVSKFAQLEFKFTSPEHGRTIMTGLLANYPRRFDLWSVFLDLEIKQGDQDLTRYRLSIIEINERRLFQRVLALKMSTKKAKFFFKKWLQWETESGDEAGVEDVKRRAREYVEGLAGE
jgi:rRNA biogenesis protein RRP5